MTRAIRGTNADRHNPNRVAYPGDPNDLAGPAKAHWLCNYLIGHGIPGLRSSKGHIIGLSGYDMFVMHFNNNHTGGVGGELNTRAKATGRKPIMVRAISGMPAESVLITMRLPDWVVLLEALVRNDPQRWLGNDDEER